MSMLLFTCFGKCVTHESRNHVMTSQMASLDDLNGSGCKA